MSYLRNLLVAGVGVVITILLSGCLEPEAVAPTEINRYQQHLAQQGKQNTRVDDGKDGLLKPAKTVGVPNVKIAPDPLTGKPRIDLSLDDIIIRTLANSSDIRVVSFDPEISREQANQAAAEFDVAAFAGISHEDARQQVDSLYQSTMESNKTTMYAGLKQKTVTGAQQSVAWQQTRSWDDALTSDGSGGYESAHRFLPLWEDTFTYQITQPLLRDAGPEFNLGKLHLAQYNEKISREKFRQKVEDTITQATTLYWTLVQARGELVIAQNLLDNTQFTYDRLKGRKDLDATKVHLKQVEAALETRKVALIRARKNILDTQDKLARLMSDSQINLLTEYEILPLTAPCTDLVQLDVADQLLTGLRHNPVLEQARLAIESAQVEVRMAENQALPKLDAIGSAGTQGLRSDSKEATAVAVGATHANYSFGLQLEYPLGNRERLAALAEKKYSKLKTIADMQSTVDQVSQVIKENIRQVQVTYEEIAADRSAVAASKAQLEALEDTERIRGQLSPEALQVKLQAQESLANAERVELQAIVTYNSALAELSRITGTTMDTHQVKLALPPILLEKPWPTGLTTQQASPAMEEVEQPQPADPGYGQVPTSKNATSNPANTTMEH
jgi:outer membrane protein TolC